MVCPVSESSICRGRFLSFSLSFSIKMRPLVLNSSGYRVQKWEYFKFICKLTCSSYIRPVEGGAVPFLCCHFRHVAVAIRLTWAVNHPVFRYMICHNAQWVWAQKSISNNNLQCLAVLNLCWFYWVNYRMT